MLKSTCLKWLTSETIEQIPNLALTKWGKRDYKSFDKIVMAAIKYSENNKGKITNLLCPSRPSCVQKPAFSWASRFVADECLWISPSAEVSQHPPSLLGRPWNSVYHLRGIKSALFGFQWTPVFLWLLCYCLCVTFFAIVCNVWLFRFCFESESTVISNFWKQIVVRTANVVNKIFP